MWRYPVIATLALTYAAVIAKFLAKLVDLSNLNDQKMVVIVELVFWKPSSSGFTVEVK